LLRLYTLDFKEEVNQLARRDQHATKGHFYDRMCWRVGVCLLVIGLREAGGRGTVPSSGSGGGK
jgi:hypothetical protein